MLIILLSSFACVVSVFFIYLTTGSFVAGLLSTLFLALVLITNCISHKGMKKMKEQETFAARNNLIKGCLWDKALLASFMVMAPLYFVHLLPLFIPVTSVYVWMIMQIPLLALDLIHIISVGQSYKDITGIKYPIYIVHGCTFLFLSVINLLFY